MRSKWQLLLCLVMLTGCKPGRPKGILSDGKMEDVLVDYHLAQGMAGEADMNPEIAQYEYIQAVFKKHHITEAQFDSSMVWYSANSELLVKIYEKVLPRLSAEAQKMGLDADMTDNQYANLTNQGDTANIWPYKRHLCLMPNIIQNIYQFELKADTSYRAGDTYIWHFHTQYLSQAMSQEAYAQLALRYENDSVVILSNDLRGMMSYDMRFEPRGKLDSIPLKSVRGFVYMPPAHDQNQAAQMVLLQDIGFIRMHKKVIVETPQPEKTDSTAEDTLKPTEVRAPHASAVRLTPGQVRDEQPRQHTINVVKENPNPIRIKRGQGFNSRRRISR